jgi:hypothetical protein
MRCCGVDAGESSSIDHDRDAERWTSGMAAAAPGRAAV